MQNLIQRLNCIRDRDDAYQLQFVLQDIYNRLRSQCLTSAGLVIKTVGSPLAKAGSIIYATAKGVIIKKAANTDMAALSGTVTNAMFNVFVFSVNSAGTLFTQMGTEGASLRL